MRRFLQIVALTLGLGLTALWLLGEPLVELLWMRELGLASVFWTVLTTKLLLFVVVFVVAAAFFALNFRALLSRIPPLWATRWASEEGEEPQMGDQPLTRARLRRLAYGLAGLVSLLFASGFATQWDALLRFWHSTPYGQADPIYGHDLSFFLLELPFVQALQSGYVGLVFLGLLLLVSAYVLLGEIGVQEGKLRLRPTVVRHLALNVVLLLLGWAWGFYLDRYELLQEPSGAVFGAGYTEIHVTLPALWVMLGATLALAALMAYNLVRYSFRSLVFGLAGYVLTLVLSLVLAPTLINQLLVVPNELERERPYLEHNIAFTREAYGLSRIEERSYPAETKPSAQQVSDNLPTLNNVRLWDPRLLIDNYQQLQQLRQYYSFYNVDIDRYTVDGAYRQVMLSAREMTERLPADSWVNRHLVYTHGYGAVANLVAEEGNGGIPNFVLKDLPPEGAETLLAEQPAIYYGERVPTYKLVNTSAREIDYPRGQDDVAYTKYAGTGGVLLDAGWKELLFAWHLGDYNLLLSDNLQRDSRIQIWNRVQERIRKVAPFLRLDRDPYLVLSERRQYWIQDAYTVSRSFPYSEPARGGLRYIRNAVKIVVDAYDGSLSFHVTDPDDPVLKAHQAAFPALFQPLDAMSDDLRLHLRYPQDLFEIQVEKYQRYHMMEPQMFYNDEDLWTRPREKYRDAQQVMAPYYIMTRLPDEDRLQFMLMTPMTPENRDNMIAWMAARCDMPGYGELIVYRLPKERQIYGPNQIESRIDQNTDISRQFSLWDQRGSRVVRGNLIVVPIEASFLYVEPIYLIAEGVRIPELKRVIVSYGDRVVMEPTLEQAVNRLFGQPVMQTDAALAEAEALPTPRPPTSTRTLREKLDEARRLLDEARRALREGDFARFGNRFDALGAALRDTTTTAAAAAPRDTAAATPTTPAAYTPDAQEE